jgi:hypothetical protein
MPCSRRPVEQPLEGLHLAPKPRVVTAKPLRASFGGPAGRARGALGGRTRRPPSAPGRDRCFDAGRHGILSSASREIRGVGRIAAAAILGTSVGRPRGASRCGRGAPVRALRPSSGALDAVDGHPPHVLPALRAPCPQPLASPRSRHVARIAPFRGGGGRVVPQRREAARKGEALAAKRGRLPIPGHGSVPPACRAKRCIAARAHVPPRRPSQNAVEVKTMTAPVNRSDAGGNPQGCQTDCAAFFVFRLSGPLGCRARLLRPAPCFVGVAGLRIRGRAPCCWALPWNRQRALPLCHQPIRPSGVYLLL